MDFTCVWYGGRARGFQFFFGGDHFQHARRAERDSSLSWSWLVRARRARATAARGHPRLRKTREPTLLFLRCTGPAELFRRMGPVLAELRSQLARAPGLHRLEHDGAVGVVDGGEGFGDVPGRVAPQDALPCLRVAGEQIEGRDVVTELVLLRAKREAIGRLRVRERDERQVRRDRPERAPGRSRGSARRRRCGRRASERSAGT